MIVDRKWWAATLTAMLLSVAASASAAVQETSAVPATGAPVQVLRLRLRPDFYMLTVDGVNVGLETGPEGAVVVDTGPASAVDALLKTIEQLTPQPIRFVVDTSADEELTSGNAKLSAAGHSLMILWTDLRKYDNRASSITDPLIARAPIIARGGVLEQIIVGNPGAPVSALALPSEIFTRPQYNFRINGDIVNVVGMPPAHSDVDSVVLFRHADVVVTGAIFDITHFPVLDLAHGGSIDGEIAAINQVMNTLAVPSGPLVNDADGTLVIPVHGPVCNEPDLLTYRDMLYAVRNRVQALINQGKSLEQVEAADPTQGYEQRFGSSRGGWTTQDFVEAIYRSLKTVRVHERGRG